jgi:hypothetical protein
MKRLTFFALIGCTLTIFGCKKTIDIDPPVIVLNGENPDIVIQYSSMDYIDLGATVYQVDGELIPYTVNGKIEMNKAGVDTLFYYAIDNNGLSGHAQRVVIVDGAQLISGNYSVADFNDSISTGNGNDTINVDAQSYNSIYFKKFAGYNDCILHGLTIDSTLTIPTQTINCGSPLADRTFSGTGLYSKDFFSFTIYYTETTNSVTKNGHCIYTKN